MDLLGAKACSLCMVKHDKEFQMCSYELEMLCIQNLWYVVGFLQSIASGSGLGCIVYHYTGYIRKNEKKKHEHIMAFGNTAACMYKRLQYFAAMDTF